jgi:hypothetical protein
MSPAVERIAPNILMVAFRWADCSLLEMAIIPEFLLAVLWALCGGEYQTSAA